ncbi:hypothetical protein GUA87_01470 [Sneathiella sp. P13V-1]|uniref:hypothetical protein n=1 Tax=Sneathiella sp. P13V-1 TaxID=2697366 RepID=UPI00187B6BC2|nr:hypothetical protein [Sneathiella sp. P13V-1]MBE7635497.1 hypothetical protein [Sneathiella sp. P13V-1]
MNSLVIFELILVMSAIAALVLMRRTYFPMNLFWAFGVSTIALAALLGAAVYGGMSDFKPYHKQLSAFAGSIGIISFAIAAVGGVFARQFHQAGWWIVLIGLLSLTGVTLFDRWQLSEEIRYGVVGLLALAALYRLFVKPNSGIFIFAGVVFLVAAGLGSAIVAAQFSVPELNVYHSFLSASVLSFGIFASKE